jgi:hypothetical protein
MDMLDRYRPLVAEGALHQVGRGTDICVGPPSSHTKQFGSSYRATLLIVAIIQVKRFGSSMNIGFWIMPRAGPIAGR